MVSADNLKAWTTPQERPLTLELVLGKRTYILPWVQFLYAEGGDGEVRIAFATHDVTVRGSGLQTFLADVAAQRIAQVQESRRPDQFDNRSGPIVREISVSKIEENARDQETLQQDTIPKPAA